MRGLVVADQVAELRPDIDPQSVAPTLESHQPTLLQFSEPLSEHLLDAAATALEQFPEIGLRVYGRSLDHSLAWLERFAHVRDLAIDLWHATSFDLLGSFGELKHLSLGETSSKRPSLDFLRQLTKLEVLRIEAHDHGFEAIADVQTLRELHLRVPRGKTLDSLRRHPQLEVIALPHPRADGWA